VNSALVNPGQQGAQPPIPSGEDGSIVRVPLFDDHGVVDAVHGGGNKKNPEKRFKPPGRLKTAVMELGAQYQGTFKDGHADRTRPNKKDERDLDHGGHGQFTNVKPCGRGHVHIQVAVMNPMKSPQEGDLVVEEMPHVQHEIHEDHCGKDSGPQGHVQHIEYAQLAGRYIGGSTENSPRKHQEKKEPSPKNGGPNQ